MWDWGSLSNLFSNAWNSGSSWLSGLFDSGAGAGAGSGFGAGVDPVAATAAAPGVAGPQAFAPAAAPSGGGMGFSAAGIGALEGGGGGFAPMPGGAGGFGDFGAANPITGASSDGMGTVFNPASMNFGGSPSLTMASSLGAPPGMDPIAAANFAAENTANPAGTVSVRDVIAGSPGASSGGFDGSGIMKFLKANPSLLLGAGGIGLAAARRPSIPNLPNMTSAGNRVQETANALLPAEQTGQLPPGMQSMVSNALNDTIANIKSKYAGMGLSGSSSEQQEISAARERAAAETADLAMKVTNQGLNAMGLSEQIFSHIAQLRLAQDSGLSDAIGRFSGAAALGAGMRGIQTS